MKHSLVIVLFLFSCIISEAQLFGGVALGTFHVRGNSDHLMGYGPNIRLEYIGDDETSKFFLDGAFYRKAVKGEFTEIYDGNGTWVGDAATTETYSIEHLQLGFKRSFVGDFDTKVCWFGGGGAALSFVNTVFKYDLAGYKIPKDTYNKTIFGFHFNTGVQWRIKKVIVELRGNFDMMIKPIEVAGGDNHSYFLSSTRLGVVYPLTKY